MSSTARYLSLLVLALFLTTSLAHAQRSSGSVGVGAQVGDPSGLTLKIYNADAPSYDFLAAWSGLNDFFFLNGHAVFENTIPADNVEQPLEWYIGPGAYVGFWSDNDLTNEAVFGISGTIGIQMLLADHFELYIQATPRFNLVPGTNGDLGGGLGLRYYF